MDYIDSSAFAKYFSKEVTEKGAEKVKELIEKAIRGEGVFISSVIMIGEIVSAFDKWTRRKLLSDEQFKETLSEFVKNIKKLTENGSLILVDANVFGVSNATNYIII